MAVAESYAGPGLRWGLMLEDHPGAWADFKTQTGDELGIPGILGGGDTLYCVATVHFPDDTGRLPVMGFKHIPADPQPPNTPNKDGHLSDLWQTLCTKALGRAVGRAGYPANIPDLQALVVWRKRNNEITALQSGHATLALTESSPEKALGAAGRSSADDADDDGNDDDVVEGELVDADDSPEAGAPDLTLVPPSPATMTEVRATINALGPLSSELARWAKDNDIRVGKPQTEHDAQRLLAHGKAMLTGTDAEPDEHDEPVVTPDDVPPADDAPTPETILELVAGLNDAETRAYTAFLESVHIDPTIPVAEWAGETLVEVLGWLDPGGVDS